MLALRFALGLLLAGLAAGVPAAAPPLSAGFASRDITPQVGQRPVWLAGYGQNRAATGVHDPLYCRAVVLSDGRRTVALASVDLVGLQRREVERIRARLPELDYVLVASTHNHEGPDVIGLWGPSPRRSGVDPDYLELVVRRTADCVREAAGRLEPVAGEFATRRVRGLLRDTRLPLVYDDQLRVLALRQTPATGADKPPLAGLIVQWNCHPESLGARNTLITADYPFALIRSLHQRYDCPVVFFVGAVGGLMTNPGRLEAGGRTIEDERFEFAEAYGSRLAGEVARAVESARPLPLAPIEITARPFDVPIGNVLYIAAHALGVLQRPIAAGRAGRGPGDGGLVRLATRSEVCRLRLGRLRLIGVPGEIYPELVYGRYQDPPDPGADFPKAPLEPSLVSLVPDDNWMLVGLANDEIGYIIPKRQWDWTAPYAYGRTQSQYGEINSCGCDVAPAVMEALRRILAP